MKLKTWRIFACCTAAVIAAAAIAAAVMGGCSSCVETASGSCVDMACNYAVKAVACIDALGAASVLGLAFVKCKIGRRWLAGLGIASQLLAFACLYTSLFGLCANAQMQCHTTATVATVLGCVAIVLCAVAIAQADPKKASLPKRGL